jgi:hypothetical protein
VADISCTVRKAALPEVLLQEIDRHIEQPGAARLRARYAVDVCMERIERFNSLAVYVPDIREYHRFISLIFNKQTTALSLFFSREKWEKMCRIQNEHNIGCGDIVRLVFASLLFHSGKIALPVEQLSRLFFTERQAYTFNLTLARPVAELLSDSEQTMRPVNREVITRAAHCYFSHVPEALPEGIDESRYRIDNAATGWSRQTVTGSREMKSYFRGLKESRGKPLATVIAHTVYSFLNQVREAAGRDER